MWTLQGQHASVHFLVHDRDSKFTRWFEAVFASESIHVIRTPICAPNPNALAERWVRTIHEACLDKRLIFNEAHLRGVLRAYINDYHTARPH